ncbi:hypothetical protein QR680_006228 [Steinernema hermaphroditum]|uniref:EGF-like domain-containing protein n=1 Tax=Steinernema hermaphroditum TaxID=289476 RepID=A0AA39LX25_9BILA|nr:hypothetical protein QR680_006228 [Steinernema hermaphroditum]
MKTFFVGFVLVLAVVSARPSEDAKCGKNEHFSPSECNGCDMTCFAREHTICPAMCHPPQCMCNPGFYRDPMNRCVAPAQCPAVLPPFQDDKQVVPSAAEEPKCGKNEHFSSSNCNGCDMTCFAREHTICPAMCHPPQCMCNPGFYRDPMNRCVAPAQCPAVLPPFRGTPEPKNVVSRNAEEEPKCGKNEHFSPSECNGCDMTCFAREHTICPAMCHPPQCMCNPGFYRDPMKRCVAPAQCPAVLPPFTGDAKQPESH